jgi:ABC-type multidrug transport system ATPase subunit
MMEQPWAIETHGLSKQFGARRAVDGVDLRIPQGSVFGFLGPNGAGKTTTIRMLLGLVRPTSGGGTVCGYDIVRERAKLLPHVGAIVESPAFYPYLSGRDNLLVIARTAGVVDHARIGDVLALVDLAARAHDKVKTYSLGMKQRLAIAAALLNRPQIVFLDEPTNGLDPAGTVEMRGLITRLGQEGHTIFLSSHLLHEVEQVCSEIAIINQGRVVTHQRVAELARESAALLVRAEPVPILQAVAERMNVVPQLAADGTATLPLAPNQAAPLVAALVQAGAQVHQITPHRRTLEQHFLSLTNGVHAADPSITNKELSHADAVTG